MRPVRMIVMGILATALFGTTPAIAHQDIRSSDVDRFWRTYDSIRKQPFRAEQRRLLKAGFIHPGSSGLKAFMQAKGYDADCYVDAIRNYPRFWDSVRAHTFELKRRADELAPDIERFRALYPQLRPARIYFTIGCLRSGGTTVEDMVLIGTELAAGSPDVDVSELPERLREGLGSYFAGRPAEQLVLLNMHEYVHTQQHGEGATLLSRAMYEGAADFVAEQVTGQTPHQPYMQYGPAHEAELRTALSSARDSTDWGDWLYNGRGGARGVGDLGYYVGYTIMRDYYARASDKQQALREIIELDYDDPIATARFAQQAGFPAH